MSGDFTDKERLESAKINIDWDRNKIPPELLPHIDYLTEQAERFVAYIEETIKIHEQNKRYREALEEIAKNKLGIADSFGSIRTAKRALEKEE